MDTISMLEIKARAAHSARLVPIREVVGRVVTLLEAADKELGLCNRFRQHTGTTPAAWRRAQRTQAHSLVCPDETRCQI